MLKKNRKSINFNVSKLLMIFFLLCLEFFNRLIFILLFEMTSLQIFLYRYVENHFNIDINKSDKENSKHILIEFRKEIIHKFDMFYIKTTIGLVTK